MRRVIGFWSVTALTLLFAGQVGAQTDLKPSILFNTEGSGAWTGGDWDPGVPGAGDVAAIQSGIAEVSTAIDKVDAVSVQGGGVSVGQGGVLETDQVVVGAAGSLSPVG